jgi:hypothetical protein
MIVPPHFRIWNSVLVSFVLPLQNILDDQCIRKKGLFWPTLLEASVRDRLALFFWPCDKEAYHDEESMVEQAVHLMAERNRKG